MSFVPLNPRPLLQSLVNEEVRIKLKWGQEYTGRLVSTDSYMNLQLGGAEEWVDGAKAGTLGQVLISEALGVSMGIDPLSFWAPHVMTCVHLYQHIQVQSS
ncbi:hypothetical protein AMS68_005194 [Peltaster fructicola]|uniref:Sm protein F n=1 Tax=Peltaster fructicola TaxID=286661 RepID=A0A6H0XY23_9PEZI|nr:hypothetical protein AMS68_005194 [Peltaster fructicola]